MATNEHLPVFEQLAQEALAAYPDLFVVRWKVKPTHNYKLYLDGDQGVTIDHCVRINRRIRREIEEKGLFPEGDFSLEVSSPGIDEPLTHPRQFTKNIGRTVELVMKDDTTLLGKLVTTTDSDLMIETTTGKGKKAETQQVLVPLENIKTTTVQVIF